MSATALVLFVIGCAVGALLVCGIIHVVSVLLYRLRSGWYNGKI